MSSTSADRDGHSKGGPVSCAECRRSRLKCDRQVPCSACVRRKCADLCPDGVKPARRSQKDEAEFKRLQERIDSLEGALTHQDDERRSRSPSRSRRRSSAAYHDRPSALPSGPSQSPRSPFPQWSFANSLSQSTRIATPPSYRYHETDGALRSPSASTSGMGMATGEQRGAQSGLSGPSSAGPGMVQPSTADMGAKMVNPPEPSPNELSHGTLVIDKTGRSRYFGATAGTEWLKNQEVGGDETPWRSRSPSMPASQDHHPAPPSIDYFPFASPRPSIQKVLEQLPPYEEAQELVTSYYKYYAWNHDAAPRNRFQPVFEQAYASAAKRDDKVHLQQLALIFAILAVGTHHNLELPPNDTGSGDFVNMARLCLTADDFLNHNTIFGIQTIVILGHYCLETEKGRTGDTAWPMWGIASRMLIAMGLHRDGERWNLPPEVVQERRQVFWETQTIDCLQANCFSRPGPLGLKHIDTAFPAQDVNDAPDGAANFFTLKYQIAQFSGRIIDEGMATVHKSYEKVQRLYQDLCDFERHTIPFHMRCRTSLLALPSVYPDPEQAKRDSPDISRRNLRRTLQTFTLALNVAENIMFLQRPYFVAALNENPQDPTKSVHGHAYLAVVERCNAIIQIVATLYELHPACLSRHWFFWYHLFTAAVCLGTLVLNHPQNVLAEFAVGQIDVAIACYAALLRTTSSRTLLQNQEWLVRLRARCTSRMAQQTSASDQGTATEDNDGDVELLGWRTRLIERANRGGQRATTIPTVPNPQPSPMSINGLVGGGGSRLPTVQQVMQQHYMPAMDQGGMFGGSGSGRQGTPGMNQAGTGDHSTDMLLHQFWDPLLEAGDGSSLNWWNWDVKLDEPPFAQEQSGNRA